MIYLLFEMVKNVILAISWEKISWIILGFDPSNFSRQNKYCRLQNILKIENCKSTA